MRVLLIGGDKRIAEMQEKLKHIPHLSIQRSDGDEQGQFKEFDVIFDLHFDDDPENLPFYARAKNKWVFVSSAKQTLSEAVYTADVKIACRLVGINALPTFINKDSWEVSLYRPAETDALQTLFQSWNITAHIVPDQVGFIAPRIIFSSINETVRQWSKNKHISAKTFDALFTGEFYPLRRADEIGISDVFEVLYSLYEDTKDPKYRITPLLKQFYLRNHSFYR